MGINSLPYLAFCGSSSQSFLPISLGGTFAWIHATQFVSGAIRNRRLSCHSSCRFPLERWKIEGDRTIARNGAGRGGGEEEGEASISWTIRNTARPHFFLAATREINNHNEGTELFAAGRAAPWKKSVVICTARMTF